MVGAAGILSLNSFARTFAATASQVARPNFELQFNNLQNTIIDRLNAEVEEARAESEIVNRVDVFLIKAEKDLIRFQNGIDKFAFDNGRNINAAGELARQLDTLSIALTADDTDSFNKALTTINSVISKTTATNGISVGIYIDDGVTELRRNGLVKFDNAGTATQATSRADFADDAEAAAAIDAALAQITQVADVLVLKAEAAEGLSQRTSTSLNATVLQIQATLIANDAEKAEEIAKLQADYAQLLNGISLAFEVSQALADRLAAQLFNPNAVPAGSAVNILL